jgi:hypothetical protein
MISPSGTNYSETSNLEDLKTKPGKVGGPAHTNDEVRILSCLIRRQYSIFMKKILFTQSLSRYIKLESCLQGFFYNIHDDVIGI